MSSDDWQLAPTVEDKIAVLQMKIEQAAEMKKNLQEGLNSLRQAKENGSSPAEIVDATIANDEYVLSIFEMKIERYQEIIEELQENGGVNIEY